MANLKKYFLLAVLFSGLWIFAPLPAHAAEVVVHIRNFARVTSHIYRGARPTQQGLSDLARLGVRTDLDLENDMDDVAREARWAKADGIQLVSVPMSGFWAPSNAAVERALDVLDDPADFPVFVHCHHGQDRAGLIVGLYRVFYQNWTPKAAYQEMLRMGFHPILLGLNHYFEEATGYED